MNPIRAAQALRDEFEMFPLEAALRALQVGVDDASVAYDQHGVMRSSNHETVAQEHEAEVMWLLLGAGFVAAQRSITQVVAIVEAVRSREPSMGWLPDSRSGILVLESLPTKEPTGLRDVQAIDAAANYFKHSDQWEADWNGERGIARETIESVRALGMWPRNARNLHVALASLGLRLEGGLAGLATIVGSWRGRVADRIHRVSE